MRTSPGRAKDADAKERQWPPPVPVTRKLLASGSFWEELAEEDEMRQHHERLVAFARSKGRAGPS